MKAVWEPQERQRIAIACPAFELFYGGAKGGGKSDFLIGDFLNGVDEYGEAHKGVIFRQSYPETEELVTRMKQIYRKLGAVFHQTDRTWTFPSGSTLKVRYLEGPASLEDYQGHQYTWIGFDELGNWPTLECYFTMITCCRSADGAPCRVRATGNPGGPGHAAIKSYFIDVAPPQTIYTDPETGLDRVFIPARLEDNLKLMENDPNYEKRLAVLKKTKPKIFEAFRWGNWDIIEGAFFDDFDRDIHMVRPFPISPYVYRFAAMDWGYSKPYSIGWYAVMPSGRLVRYRELYGCVPGQPNTGLKKSAAIVARESYALSVADGCRDMVADPSIWASRGEEGRTIAETFKAAGWRMHKAMNDRISGWNEIHSRFTETDEEGLPLLQAFSTCTEFARIMPLQQYSRTNPEDIDTRGEDHLPDEVRYAVTSALAKRKTYSAPAPRAKQEYDVLRN